MTNESLQSLGNRPKPESSKIVLRGEIMDPAEEYFRRYTEDPDDAGIFLETYVDDELQRIVIKSSALVIRSTLQLFIVSKEVDEEKISKAVEDYKFTFREALKRQSNSK